VVAQRYYASISVVSEPAHLNFTVSAVEVLQQVWFDHLLEYEIAPQI
jgi:hypothetical protein